MKQIILNIALSFTIFSMVAQMGVRGIITDAVTLEPLPDVSVVLEGSKKETSSNVDGSFLLLSDTAGEQIIVISKKGYLTRRYPLILRQASVLELSISLEIDLTYEQHQMGIIELTDAEISGEQEESLFNISGLLSASRDVFLNAASFDFSLTFFRPRGLDGAYGKILLNGIEMNKQYNGRPQWGNWGGLNDAQRNREFTMGLLPNEYTFGGLAGCTNIVMRASDYRQGGRVSYAASNRTYRGRVMASYNSGISHTGWAYSFLGSRRYGTEGYQEGTFYDANSFFIAVEKEFGENHSLNFTGIYTPNRRGRATALTEEVYRLKGNQYNPNWGYQNGQIRNSRVRAIEEPILLLNHYWNLSQNTQINTNLGYQFGTTRNSRIDSGGTRLLTGVNGAESFVGGASNPGPEYYQNLPSYFLRNENPSAGAYQNAYLAQNEFIENGQLDWNALYTANAIARSKGHNAIYVLQNDVTDDSQWTINTILSTKISEHLRLNASLNYRYLTSMNYAEIADLLGGTGYLDIDYFAEDDGSDAFVLNDVAQSDVNNRNRIVTIGERYKYNYTIDARVAGAFAQAQFTYNKLDFYTAIHSSLTGYQRTGLYENGNFLKERSFGKSEKLNFFDYQLKAGATYKITGRHLFGLNTSYVTLAPSIRNSFGNSRQNNDVVVGLSSEIIQSVDASYRYRSPFIKARLTGFYTAFAGGTDIGFYFTQQLAGLGREEGDAFVQEIVTDVNRRNIGVEMGVEVQATPTIKLKLAGSVGQYLYTNNPKLYLTSTDFEEPLIFGDGTTNLKGIHVAGGPERAYQMGFEYRHPAYWWLGATFNYFSNAYVSVSKLARSSNFDLDSDGLSYNDYDPVIAKDLLRQREFEGYPLVHIVGGKSWRIKSYFMGIFATINNILNQEYITGGFEQSRTATYRGLLEERSRTNGPIFGPRFFYGNGTTYYLNMYLRF